MRNRSLWGLVASILALSCLCSDASAGCFKRKRACQPRPCVCYYPQPLTYYYPQQPVYQQPTYASGQSNLTQLKPLPQLPAAYFPTEQP
jgi:hypothetical protein